MDYFLEHPRHHSPVLNWKRAAWTFSWTSSDVPFIMWKLGKAVQCHSSFGIVHLRDIKELTFQICHSVPREQEKIRSISAAGTRGRCVTLVFYRWLTVHSMAIRVLLNISPSFLPFIFPSSSCGSLSLPFSLTALVLLSVSLSLSSHSCGNNN